MHVLEEDQLLGLQTNNFLLPSHVPPLGPSSLCKGPHPTLWSPMHNLISASSQHWVLVAQSCLTLCDSMDSSLPDSSAHGFSRQNCWSGVSFPSPEESSPPRDQTWVSHIADRLLTIWATKEVHLNVVSFQKPHLHYGHSGVGLIIWIWGRMQTFRSAQPSYHIRLRYGWEMKVIQLPDRCQKTRRWWKSLFFFSFNIFKK